MLDLLEPVSYDLLLRLDWSVLVVEQIAYLRKFSVVLYAHEIAPSDKGIAVEA